MGVSMLVEPPKVIVQHLCPFELYMSFFFVQGCWDIGSIDFQNVIMK